MSMDENFSKEVQKASEMIEGKKEGDFVDLKKEAQGEEQEQEGPKKFTTAGGYEAMEVNGMIIRKSESMARLHDDGETREEYRVRRKFVQDMYKKKLQPKLFWMSKFSIKGQNYTSTYRVGDEKKGVNFNKEENKEEA